MELLDAVKDGLGITGEFQDNTLKIYINEVLEYLRDAGVPEKIIESERIIGITVRGVSDLWNYGSGGAELSPYFIQRAIQIAEGGEDE